MKLIYPLLILIFILGCTDKSVQKKWKGFAIIGNGDVCAVYSDDDRLDRIGIQHFYYKDYTADYIASSSARVILPDDQTFIGDKQIDMANFYTTRTKFSSGKKIFNVSVSALTQNGIIISLKKSAALNDCEYNYSINFRKNIKTDRLITLDSTFIENKSAWFKWNNQVYLNILLSDSAGKLMINDSSLSCRGKFDKENISIVILASNKIPKVTSADFSFDNLNQNYWEEWIQAGNIPEFENEMYTEFYKRNLYAAKSANLNGNVPADITGQFVTHNMPQLYPRDAMMAARVFIKTGHLEEAKQIIEFWAGDNIPQKSKGEWYARYNAYAKAVDAGSGARFDEPEWDANGYFIQLIDLYFQETGTWLVDSLKIYTVADFLVNQLDENGLLFEGGIIEWSGYLPATNMTAAAALKTASKIALTFENNQKSRMYKQAAETITINLILMFDSKNKTYADVRFAGAKSEDNLSAQQTSGDTLYLWDTSSNFGILWGYPDHKQMQQTNDFYSIHTVKLNGGVQYFEAPDPGLAAYGNDLFFFTTAALAQYLAKSNKIDQSKYHIDWMINNSNIYGLMPERIYLNNRDCSEASPLSWCCAEFAMALLELSNSKLDLRYQ